MGLANFLFNGSYLHIERAIIQNKSMACTLKIYSSDKKQSALREIAFGGGRKIWGIRVGNTPPKNPKHEEAYLLKGDLQEEWKLYPNHITWWDAQRGVWNYCIATWADILYLEDTGEYMTLNNGEFTPCVCYDDSRLWDKFFAPDILEKSNHYRQFYLCLKSLDEFKDCVDC